MSNKEWRTRVQDELNALEDLIDDCSNDQFKELANRLGELFIDKGMAVDDVMIDIEYVNNKKEEDEKGSWDYEADYLHDREDADTTDATAERTAEFNKGAL